MFRENLNFTIDSTESGDIITLTVLCNISPYTESVMYNNRIITYFEVHLPFRSRGPVKSVVTPSVGKI